MTVITGVGKMRNCGMRNAERVYGANMWESRARMRSIKWQLAYYLLRRKVWCRFYILGIYYLRLFVI